MRLHGLTVCVNYADFLSLSIERWKEGLASLTIVTDSKDVATAALAMKHDANLFQTDVFYERGAKFNKGAAMEQVRKILPWEDWFLFFDSDVIPEPYWKATLITAEAHKKVVPGALYGATRFQSKDLKAETGENNERFLFPASSIIRDAPCDGGYFHLFHTSDEAVQVPPGADLLETCWSHAGVYDSKFKMRWPSNKWLVTPVQLLHVGERENWTGRGDREGMKALLKGRVARGGGWASVEAERLK